MKKGKSTLYRVGRKDTFHEFMIENAQFEGKWEFPIIPNNIYRLPSKLTAYDQRKNKNKADYNSFLHFFVDDYKFDGPNGIWNGSKKDFYQKRGFSIEEIKKYDGIIGPDFTMGFDFPLSTQLDQCRRRRYFEYWMYSLGLQVIPFARWTDERSYEFAFLGLQNRGIVAISTFGSMKSNNLKYYFKKGLVELMKQKDPSIIVVYGTMPEDIFDIIDTNKTKLINFQSDIASFWSK